MLLPGKLLRRDYFLERFHEPVSRVRRDCHNSEGVHIEQIGRIVDPHTNHRAQDGKSSVREDGLDVVDDLVEFYDQLDATWLVVHVPNLEVRKRGLINLIYRRGNVEYYLSKCKPLLTQMLSLCLKRRQSKIRSLESVKCALNYEPKCFTHSQRCQKRQLAPNSQWT